LVKAEAIAADDIDMMIIAAIVITATASNAVAARTVATGSGAEIVATDADGPLPLATAASTDVRFAVAAVDVPADDVVPIAVPRTDDNNKRLIVLGVTLRLLLRSVRSWMQSTQMVRACAIATSN
jgi:hypothetical protein